MMTTVSNLHNKAMELAQRALLARHADREGEAAELSLEALEWEMQAAEAVENAQGSEPTRSILYRSAASLAYQCKKFEAARRLAAQGLAGYPPPEIAKEILGILEQVKADDLRDGDA